MRGVLFDLHRTLVTAGSPDAWISGALARTGTPTGAVDPTRLRQVLGEVWQRAGARHPGAPWDLDAGLHRAVFVQVLAEDAACPPRLAEELYDTMTAQWVAAPGAAELLRGLRARGVRTAVVSNTALDPCAALERCGLRHHLDAVVTSAGAGWVKPDTRIFHHAAHLLGVPPQECVHVGDSAEHDGGATAAGMTALIVPVRDGVPDLRQVTSLLGVPIGGAVGDHGPADDWPMPPSVPEGLVLELSRARVLPGRQRRAREWMAMLNDRLPECEDTLAVERSAFEAWFLDDRDDPAWIWHVGLSGDGGAAFDEGSALDADHLAFAREVKEPGWEEMEPMFLLMPPHIRAAVIRWARTGRV